MEKQLGCYLTHLHTWIGGFPVGSDGKESARNAGDLGSIPELGRSPGEGNGNPDRKSTRLNSSHYDPSRMPSSA